MDPPYVHYVIQVPIYFHGDEKRFLSVNDFSFKIALTSTNEGGRGGEGEEVQIKGTLRFLKYAYFALQCRVVGAGVNSQAKKF